ncbi:MAG: putative membrane protein [Gammaproteobacteria bacterium]|jgi:predicted membrane protein
MTLLWYDYVGTFGVIIILVVYFMLQIERIDPLGLTYSVINLLGSIMIAVSLVYAFNFASFVIEICWSLISLIGVWRYIRQRRETARTAAASP